MSHQGGSYSWQCPKCTYLNSQDKAKCEMCEYKYASMKTTSSKSNYSPPSQHNNSVEIIENNSPPGAKQQSNNLNSLKNTINSFSNDVKNFFNGFNTPDRGAQGFKSSKSVQNLSNNRNEPEPDSLDCWTCRACTYKMNPSWSKRCDVCNTKREKLKEEDDDNDLVVYDQSSGASPLSERVWKCKVCTCVNMEKDRECQACEAPRSSKSISSSSSTLSPSSSSSSNSSVKKWICKTCTYNNNIGDRCMLCNSLRNDSLEATRLLTAREWKCEVCSTKNKSNTSVCVVCENDRDVIPMDWNSDSSVLYPSISSATASSSSKKTPNGTLTSNSSGRHSTLAKKIDAAYITAEQEAERTWKNITRYCRDNKHKFVDDSFPPCDKSLFIDTKNKPKDFASGNIVWLNPENINAGGHSRDRWTVYNNPTFTDIKQGILGDCWLLSGLAVILEQPALLEKILLTKEYCPEGCYLVRLCQNGEWKTVIVDDLFPCSSQTGGLVYSKASRKQLWVPLIEKAMAKLNGSYESLIAGLTVEGLSTLTGFPCESLKLEPNPNEDGAGNTASATIDTDMVWAQLISMKDCGYIMGASCGRSNINDDVFHSYGLLPRHAYSVLNVKEVNGHRLVHLRNPWGTFGWKGDWSDQSTLWTPEMRRAVASIQNGPNNRVNQRAAAASNHEGVFWMSFDDFARFFCTVDICKTHLNWFESRLSSYFSAQNARDMIAYTMIVCETCEVNIGLYHKTIKNRHENSDLDMCFVVLRSNQTAGAASSRDGRRHSVGKVVMSSKRSIRKFIDKEHLFEPGEYLVVPFSFNFWYTSTDNNLYNLVFHSSKAIYVEQEICQPYLLADSIIELCISKGNVTSKGLTNATLFTLSTGYSGLIIVAENCNEGFYLHIEVNCENSSNVVSTRRTLTCCDSVPPLHRQVLLVLTQLEGSSMYSINYSMKYRLSSNPYLNTWPGLKGLTGPRDMNVPTITSETFGLHAPRSIFN